LLQGVSVVSHKDKPTGLKANKAKITRHNHEIETFQILYDYGIQPSFIEQEVQMSFKKFSSLPSQ